MANLSSLVLSPYNLAESGETLYRDLKPVHMSDRGSSSPNVATFRNNHEVHRWAAGTANEFLTFVYHLPHDLKQGTTPTLHIHQAHNHASDTGDVVWIVRWSYAQGYGGADAIFNAAITETHTFTMGARWEHQITDDDTMEMPAAIVSRLEPDGILLITLERDASNEVGDTFPQPVYVFEADLHYQVGQIATAERNAPFTSAGF